jgi:hypothetical protein
MRKDCRPPKRRFVLPIRARRSNAGVNERKQGVAGRKGPSCCLNAVTLGYLSLGTGRRLVDPCRGNTVEG